MMGVRRDVTPWEPIQPEDQNLRFPHRGLRGVGGRGDAKVSPSWRGRPGTLPLLPAMPSFSLPQDALGLFLSPQLIPQPGLTCI